MRSAIIVANGSGNRYGKDKLKQLLLGKYLLLHSVQTFLSIADEVIVVCDSEFWQDKLPSGVKLVNGGCSRHLSVRAGVSMLDDGSTVVAIHDGARPFISVKQAQMLYEQAEQYGNAISSRKIVDTVYSIDDGVDLANREELICSQTPQVFDRTRLETILKDDSAKATDEAQLYLNTYGTLNFVDIGNSNNKITFEGDIPQYRIGIGYDLHRLVEGDGIVLGGVNIACNKSAVAHSDGDVLIHAVMDSLLSAIGERDIGAHFPDTDDRYLDINSMLLIQRVMDMVNVKGYSVINISAVVIAQEPKLSAYIESIRLSIAQAVGVCADCVGITATTTEHLGVIGQGNAIAVNAQSLLQNIRLGEQ